MDLKILKVTGKILMWVLFVPLSYLLIALLLSVIPTNEYTEPEGAKEIYLSTNGVHSDIIIPVELLNDHLKKGMYLDSGAAYVAFGWGDWNFYLNTPEWSDLKMSTAIRALFMESKTLMHVSRHSNRRLSWLVVSLSEPKLEALLNYISNGFKSDEFGHKIRLLGQGYTPFDDFYEANGNYSLLTTCNGWANAGFKKAGLRTAVWTPFDFGIMRWYE